MPEKEFINKLDVALVLLLNKPNYKKLFHKKDAVNYDNTEQICDDWAI